MTNVQILELKQTPANVKMLRQQFKLTQQQLATASGIDPAAIIHAEFDISPLTDKQWKQLISTCLD